MEHHNTRVRSWNFPAASEGSWLAGWEKEKETAAERSALTRTWTAMLEYCTP